jgi:DNA-binding MarR family transcriptional regulator
METTTNETAARLRRAVTRLNRRLRHSSLGGISPSQASLLASIENLGNPSLGELAIAEQVQPPSITHLVRSMQDADLISRQCDSDDRRCTRVQLTAKGRREIAAIRQRKTEFLEEKLRSMSASDRRKVEELVGFLEKLMEDS